MLSKHQGLSIVSLIVSRKIVLLVLILSARRIATISMPVVLFDSGRREVSVNSVLPRLSAKVWRWW